MNLESLRESIINLTEIYKIELLITILDSDELSYVAKDMIRDYWREDNLDITILEFTYRTIKYYKSKL